MVLSHAISTMIPACASPITKPRIAPHHSMARNSRLAIWLTMRSKRSSSKAPSFSRAMRAMSMPRELAAMLVATVLAMFASASVGAQTNDDLAALNKRVSELHSAGKYGEAIPLAERSLARTRAQKGEEFRTRRSSFKLGEVENLNMI
mgnify:CR=1 FL=1